jgi:hypothetical protein
MSPGFQEHHPLRRWFAGLVEDSLYARLGICEPAIADYLVDLLVDFVHVDRIFALRDVEGRRLEEVAEMLTEAVGVTPAGETSRRRLVHKHIGDFTLFWTGIYPENLRRLRSRHRKDQLIDYLGQGKRSYAIASELTRDAGEPPPAALLRRLSDQFEECVYGLSLVRRGWEERDPHGLAALRAIWT